MATSKSIGEHLWGGTKAFGNFALDGAKHIGADIGNTGQAVLYGWSTQAAHNATMRLSEEAAIAEDKNRIESQPEVAKTGPEKD